MQKGKKLEKEVSDYLKKEDIFFHKFTDSYSSRNFSQPVPADFIVFQWNACAILLECKETQKEKMPLTSFRPSQFKAMKQQRGNLAVTYYVIVKHGNHYNLVFAQDILDCLSSVQKTLDLQFYAKFYKIEDVMEFMFDENLDWNK